MLFSKFPMLLIKFFRFKIIGLEPAKIRPSQHFKAQQKAPSEEGAFRFS